MSHLGCDGEHRDIPPSPCFVEQENARQGEIGWGTKSQNSNALSIGVKASAADRGYLVSLDQSG